MKEAGEISRTYKINVVALKGNYNRLIELIIMQSFDAATAANEIAKIDKWLLVDMLLEEHNRASCLLERLHTLQEEIQRQVK